MTIIGNKWRQCPAKWLLISPRLLCTLLFPPFFHSSLLYLPYFYHLVNLLYYITYTLYIIVLHSFTLCLAQDPNHWDGTVCCKTSLLQTMTLFCKLSECSGWAGLLSTGRRRTNDPYHLDYHLLHKRGFSRKHYFCKLSI